MSNLSFIVAMLMIALMIVMFQHVFCFLRMSRKLNSTESYVYIQEKSFKMSISIIYLQTIQVRDEHSTTA